VITGFNTDIEHDGVVYHVQTEDKGLDSPLILSLVYSGGAILASKRSPYQDLIASGFDEEALIQRVKHQHRLICAAINAGRIDDLKRMGAQTGERAEDVQTPAEAAPLEIVTNADDYASLPQADQHEPIAPVEIVSNASDYSDFAPISEPTPPPPAAEVADTQPRQTVAESSPYTVYDSRRQSPLGEAAAPDEGLVLTLLSEEDFRAGQTFQIRILVEDRSGAKERPLADVSLSVKILGTTFRPQIYSVKTERDGIAVVSAQIPKFTSGRAGILIRADAGGRTAETRRVIHAARD
jgi:hypothetical protein